MAVFGWLKENGTEQMGQSTECTVHWRELFTLLHLFLLDSYWTPGILPDWTRTGTNFMLADHHTNFVSQS